MLFVTLFLYGFLAGCAGLLIQTLLIVLFGQDAALTQPALVFVIAAAAVEEFMKFGFLIQAIRRFGSQITLVSASLFGLGFASVEIGLFLSSGWNQPLTALPLPGLNILFHILTAVALAACLRRFSPRHPLAWGTLGLATLLHALYNLSRLSA